MVHTVIEMVFFFLYERFEDFSYPEAITDRLFNNKPFSSRLPGVQVAFV